MSGIFKFVLLQKLDIRVAQISKVFNCTFRVSHTTFRYLYFVMKQKKWYRVWKAQLEYIWFGVMKFIRSLYAQPIFYLKQLWRTSAIWISGIIDESLIGLDQEDPLLIEAVKKRLIHPDLDVPYNLPGDDAVGVSGQFQQVNLLTTASNWSFC